MTHALVDSLNKKSETTTEEMFDAIHGVMHLVRSEQYRILRDGPHELTHMEGKLLGFFAAHPGATLSELVVRFSRDKGQLARLIKGLKKRRLLSAKADPADRRSARLHPTSEGMRVHEALVKQLKRLTRIAARGVNAEERAQLVRLLAKLRTNLERAGN